MDIEKSIEILKNSIADYVIGEYCEKCADNKICDDRNEDCYYQQAIDIVVTAYEDSQLEIEELKSRNQGKTEALEEWINGERVSIHCIHKNKIKEILGIEEEADTEKILSLLQTIVDENNRLENIEDRKVQIVYNNVFNKGVKSVEDKIKAKIEEVSNGTYDAKIVLESLLEKE